MAANTFDFTSKDILTLTSCLIFFLAYCEGGENNQDLMLNALTDIYANMSVSEMNALLDKVKTIVQEIPTVR